MSFSIMGPYLSAPMRQNKSPVAVAQNSVAEPVKTTKQKVVDFVKSAGIFVGICLYPVAAVGLLATAVVIGVLTIAAAPFVAIGGTAVALARYLREPSAKENMEHSLRTAPIVVSIEDMNSMAAKSTKEEKFLSLPKSSDQY